MMIKIPHCCITGKNSFGILFHFFFFHEGKPFIVSTSVLREIEIIVRVKHFPIETYGIIVALVFHGFEREGLKPLMQNIKTFAIYRINSQCRFIRFYVLTSGICL